MRSAIAAEVVQRHLRAELLEFVQSCSAGCVVTDQRCLLELELQLPRPQTGFLDDRGDESGQPWFDELARAEVDGHAESRQARILPTLQLGAGTTQHPCVERIDQDAVFSDRNETFRPDQALLRVLPTQERLDAPDRA
jgi:hypothetical protein